MVEVKFVIEIVIVIIALALALYWFYTNYQSVSLQFWAWLEKISPSLAKGGGK